MAPWVGLPAGLPTDWGWEGREARWVVLSSANPAAVSPSLGEGRYGTLGDAD